MILIIEERVNIVQSYLQLLQNSFGHFRFVKLQCQSGESLLVHFWCAMRDIDAKISKRVYFTAKWTINSEL